MFELIQRVVPLRQLLCSYLLRFFLPIISSSQFYSGLSRSLKQHLKRWGITQIYQLLSQRGGGRASEDRRTPGRGDVY